MKNTIIAVLAIIIIGIGGYFLFMKSSSDYTAKPVDKDVVDTTADTISDEDKFTVEDKTDEEPVNEKETVLGTSVEERNITAYHYGTGDTELLFVGGIHGGYSWNTVL